MKNLGASIVRTADINHTEKVFSFKKHQDI